ncbi:MAG: hypothetical protein AB7O62_02215 [Pirellulales bacterium]
MRHFPCIAVLTLAVGLLPAAARADHKWGLNEGNPDLQSAGQLTFGPDGILFVGDAKGAAVFAIDTGDTKSETASAARTIANLNERFEVLLGKGTKIAIHDMAVNPLSGNVYLSISHGEDPKPAIMRVAAPDVLTEVKLADIPFLKADIPNPPEDKVTGEGPRARNRRNEAITDLAYVEGKLLVSGSINAAASSTVYQIPFPFAEVHGGTNIEIYHGAHGKLEDTATIRTFVPFTINGEASLLAGFTCTPLVRFPLDSLEEGEKVRGTTVAELGNRNVPLDMIVYKKGGEEFVLMANSVRGVMKISTQDIGRKEGIEKQVGGGGTAGQEFKTLQELDGTVQVDRLGDSQAVLIVQKDGNLSLKTIPLP